MKDRVRLVLARWADVEPGDTVWADDALWRVTGEAFTNPDATEHDRKRGNLSWPVEKVGGDYCDRNTLTARPEDQVPIVEEG